MCFCRFDNNIKAFQTIGASVNNWGGTRNKGLVPDCARSRGACHVIKSPNSEDFEPSLQRIRYKCIDASNEVNILVRYGS